MEINVRNETADGRGVWRRAASTRLTGEVDARERAPSGGGLDNFEHLLTSHAEDAINEVGRSCPKESEDLLEVLGADLVPHVERRSTTVPLAIVALSPHRSGAALVSMLIAHLLLFSLEEGVHSGCLLLG